MGVYSSGTEHIKNDHPHLVSNPMLRRVWAPINLWGRDYVYSRCGIVGCKWFYWGNTDLD